LDCGDSIPDRIPYYAVLVLMIGTTYYSSRQTQKATPSSAQNQQTQIITKVMPIMFGIFGFAFPAGLVLYWTVSNVFQIGQQAVMLRLGHIGPDAMDRRLSQAKAKASSRPDKPRSGFMSQIMERAENERKRRQGEPEPLRKPPPRTSGKGGSGKSTKGGSGRPKGSGPNRPRRPGR
jgi:YidC/Oxa1 family membrane protein insertase